MTPYVHIAGVFAALHHGDIDGAADQLQAARQAISAYPATDEVTRARTRGAYEAAAAAYIERAAAADPADAVIEEATEPVAALAGAVITDPLELADALANLSAQVEHIICGRAEAAMIAQNAAACGLDACVPDHDPGDPRQPHPARLVLRGLERLIGELQQHLTVGDVDAELARLTSTDGGQL